MASEDFKGLNMGGGIIPLTETDTYPTHFARFGNGGWRSVASYADLANISWDRLEVGMAVYVTGENAAYICETKPATKSGTATWRKLATDGVLEATDYTAFEVYANSTVIPIELSQALRGYVTQAIPAGMTESFELRTTFHMGAKAASTTEEKAAARALVLSNINVSWGDGTTLTAAEIEPSAGDGYSDTYVKLSHTYTTDGAYIVRVYGDKYWKLMHYDPAKNLIHRILEYDLPIAKHFTNWHKLAYGAKRLIYITAREYYVQFRGYNLNNAFSNCPNLLEATGFSTQMPCALSCNGMFQDDVNLVHTDLVLPQLMTVEDGADGYRNMFMGCTALGGGIVKRCEKVSDSGYTQYDALLDFDDRTSLASLLPSNGFLGKYVNIYRAFYGCENLCSGWTKQADGTYIDTASGYDVDPKLLWEDPRITWYDTRECFTGTSELLRSTVPTSWGGSNDNLVTLHNVDNVEMSELVDAVVSSAIADAVSDANCQVFVDDTRLAAHAYPAAYDIAVANENAAIKIKCMQNVAATVRLSITQSDYACAGVTVTHTTTPTSTTYEALQWEGSAPDFTRSGTYVIDVPVAGTGKAKVVCDNTYSPYTSTFGIYQYFEDELARCWWCLDGSATSGQTAIFTTSDGNTALNMTLKGAIELRNLTLSNTESTSTLTAGTAGTTLFYITDTGSGKTLRNCAITLSNAISPEGVLTGTNQLTLDMTTTTLSTAGRMTISGGTTVVTNRNSATPITISGLTVTEGHLVLNTGCKIDSVVGGGIDKARITSDTQIVTGSTLTGIYLVRTNKASAFSSITLVDCYYDSGTNTHGSLVVVGGTLVNSYACNSLQLSGGAFLRLNPTVFWSVNKKLGGVAVVNLNGTVSGGCTLMLPCGAVRVVGATTTGEIVDQYITPDYAITGQLKLNGSEDAPIKVIAEVYAEAGTAGTQSCTKTYVNVPDITTELTYAKGAHPLNLVDGTVTVAWDL